MNKADAARERLDVVMAYRRLFLDEQGQVLPDAKAVFRDVAAFCQVGNPHVGRDNDGRIDPLHSLNLVSRGEVYSHIERRLMTPVADLKRMIEGADE